MNIQTHVLNESSKPKQHPMNLYAEFFIITFYMVITYHMIAIKYRKSTGFAGFTPASKVSWVSLHILIVSTNIFFYFWFI